MHEQEATRIKVPRENMQGVKDACRKGKMPRRHNGAFNVVSCPCACTRGTPSSAP
ncbi:hypothetical protein HAX54_048612, partial [Datura stramonium]|nr:hypothetical protein [Datura stramonium]